MAWYCYIIKCVDGSLYAGVTSDLNKRFRDHKRGKGSVFTTKHVPEKFVWTESFKEKGEAMRREKEIKGWRREKKLKLIGEFTRSPSG